MMQSAGESVPEQRYLNDAITCASHGLGLSGPRPSSAGIPKVRLSHLQHYINLKTKKHPVPRVAIGTHPKHRPRTAPSTTIRPHLGDRPAWSERHHITASVANPVSSPMYRNYFDRPTEFGPGQVYSPERTLAARRARVALDDGWWKRMSKHGYTSKPATGGHPLAGTQGGPREDWGGARAWEMPHLQVGRVEFNFV